MSTPLHARDNDSFALIAGLGHSSHQTYKGTSCEAFKRRRTVVVCGNRRPQEAARSGRANRVLIQSALTPREALAGLQVCLVRGALRAIQDRRVGSTYIGTGR